jgi:hypothetical protein
MSAAPTLCTDIPHEAIAKCMTSSECDEENADWHVWLSDARSGVLLLMFVRHTST